MKDNTISKLGNDTKNKPYINGILFHRETGIVTNMGLVDTKTVDSTANVINKVESKEIDLGFTNTLLIIIVVILCANVFFKIYKLHNKCLKKKYLSKANDLDKI